MQIKNSYWPPLILHMIALIVYTSIFLARQNYEFLIYVGVLVFFMWLIIHSAPKVDYPTSLIWGLTIWSIIHMSGGGIVIGGVRLYDMILIPILGEPYNIFRYDQFAHIFGFAVATILMYSLLKPILMEKLDKFKALSFVVVMAGMGAGALNEVIEFVASLLIATNGVGGYMNTSLDLVSNMIGAVGAMAYLLIFEVKKDKKAKNKTCNKKV